MKKMKNNNQNLGNGFLIDQLIKFLQIDLVLLLPVDGDQREK